MPKYFFKSNFCVQPTFSENNLDMIKYNSTVLQAITVMTIMLYSCDDKTVDPKKFNEIIAEIVDVTPGHTLNFKATGSNTTMGCDIYNISTFISGTDVNNAMLLFIFQ